MIDLYSTHRTISSVSLSSTDPYALTNSDLDELFRSMGYDLSASLRGFDENPLEQKVQFFLDLVNLYKVKGTPQSLVDVLQYYGVTKVDIYEFFLKKNKYFGVIHNKVTQLKDEGFNHKIERLHNNVRQRTKTFRGFKNLNSANCIMKGFEIYYNFIMKHQAINKCPYELATTLKLKENNKWLELIRVSKEKYIK